MDKNSKFVNSLNAIAFTINSLVESNKDMVNTVNAVCAAIDLDARSKQFDVPELPYLKTNRTDRLKERLNDAVERSQKALGYQIPDPPSLMDTTEQDVANMEASAEDMMIICSELMQSSESNKAICDGLNESIDKITGYYEYLARSLEKLAKSQDVLDSSVAAAHVMNDSHQKSIDNLTSILLTLGLTVERIDDMISDTRVTSESLSPVISELKLRISAIDDAVLDKTEKVRDDILAAIDEVRSYAKPMADRIRALEKKVGDMGGDFDLPDTSIETPRARNRRR